jgi:arylsulfatase A-like enzyme
MKRLLNLIFLIYCSTLYSQSKPNFIFILSDDQSWNGTSVLMDPSQPDSRSDYYQTPVLEALAKKGMIFSQGYASAPKCAPTRISILTGKSTSRLHFTFTDNSQEAGTRVLEAKTELAIPDSLTTIAEWLKKQGLNYITAHYGKWHIQGKGPAFHGFDRGDGDTGNDDGNHDGLIQTNPRNIFSITDSACVFMSDAVKNGKPFYVQLSHHAPRSPIEATQKSVDEWKDLTKHPLGKRHKDPEYGAMLQDLDAGLNILFNKIKELNITDNTYIIYIGDNGAGGNNSPLKGGKSSTQEGGIRVPFMIIGPGIPSNTYQTTPVVAYDLFPTIASLASNGNPVLPPLLDGTSLLPLLKPQLNLPFNRNQQELVFHCPHFNPNTFPQSAWIDKDYKLLVDYEADKIQLFDLKKDISETTDLTNLLPAKARELTIKLRDYLKKVETRMVMLNPAYSKFTGIGDDLDKDSLPDTWEFKELLTTSFKGFEDPDKDGYSNWNEWKNNTDPYIFNNTTSIFDLLESSDLFVIQENPFRDFISIKLKNISKHLNVELMLFDINGNMLERILYSGNETNIRLNTVFLNAGSYLVCCRIPSTKQVQYQLVLKH